MAFLAAWERNHLRKDVLSSSSAHSPSTWNLTALSFNVGSTASIAATSALLVASMGSAPAESGTLAESSDDQVDVVLNAGEGGRMGDQIGNGRDA
jgi:hypothetical protein